MCPTHLKYDRQIPLLSEAGQRSLSTCRVCILSLTPSSLELAKNLALAGVGYFTLVDDRPSDANNLYELFLYSSENFEPGWHEKPPIIEESDRIECGQLSDQHRNGMSLTGLVHDVGKCNPLDPPYYSVARNLSALLTPGDILRRASRVPEAPVQLWPRQEMSAHDMSKPNTTAIECTGGGKKSALARSWLTSLNPDIQAVALDCNVSSLIHEVYVRRCNTHDLHPSGIEYAENIGDQASLKETDDIKNFFDGFDLIIGATLTLVDAEKLSLLLEFSLNSSNLYQVCEDCQVSQPRSEQQDDLASYITPEFPQVSRFTEGCDSPKKSQSSQKNGLSQTCRESPLRLPQTSLILMDSSGYFGSVRIYSPLAVVGQTLNLITKEDLRISSPFSKLRQLADQLVGAYKSRSDKDAKIVVPYALLLIHAFKQSSQLSTLPQLSAEEHWGFPVPICETVKSREQRENVAQHIRSFGHESPPQPVHSSSIALERKKQVLLSTNAEEALANICRLEKPYSVPTKTLELLHFAEHHVRIFPSPSSTEPISLPQCSACHICREPKRTEYPPQYYPQSKSQMQFWILAKAAAGYLHRHDGFLPFCKSELPDMQSDTESYLLLKDIYFEKAKEDLLTFKQILSSNILDCLPSYNAALAARIHTIGITVDTPQAAREVGLKADLCSNWHENVLLEIAYEVLEEEGEKTISAFITSLSGLQLINGMSIQAEFRNMYRANTGQQDFTMQNLDPGEELCVVSYLLHMALKEFRRIYKRPAENAPQLFQTRTQPFEEEVHNSAKDSSNQCNFDNQQASVNVGHSSGCGDMKKVSEIIEVLCREHFLGQHVSVQDQMVREAIQLQDTQLFSVSTLIGSVAAQESLKILTKHFEPISTIYLHHASNPSSFSY